MKKIIFGLSIGALALLSQCTSDKATVCDDVSFTADVKPIINTYCVTCHYGGYQDGDFTTYEGLKAKVDNGAFSLRVIQQRTMPPTGNPAPTEADIAKLKCWLSAG